MEVIYKDIDKPYGFIYITTNLVNGKRYIGQKKLYTSHGDAHTYLGSGNGIKKAIEKYGVDNFTRDIVAWAYSKEELDMLEYEWIKNLNAVKSEDYYNLVDGGDLMNVVGDKRKIKILCTTTNKIFDSIRDAGEEYNLTENVIRCILNGGKSRTTTFLFRYYNEETIEILNKGHKFCRVCGKEFSDKQNKTTHCSKHRHLISKQKGVKEFDFCVVCGKVYLPTSNRQKYCVDCAKVVNREKQRDKKRKQRSGKK